MDSIARLRSLLLGVTSHGIQHGEQELFDELMVHKSCLLNLFDVGGRNPQEQRELESGKTMLNGKPVAVNADFTRQVLFLSQQLETSERYIAGLIHSVTTENPNIQPTDCIELAVAQFHARRRQLAECLVYIFQAAQVADLSDASSTLTRIADFIQKDLLSLATSRTTAPVSLASRLVRELQNLGSSVAKADAARKSARTGTVPPSAQGVAPSLGYDILNARYESLKYERRSLATCLCIIARLGYMSPNELKAVVDWLSSTPNQPLSFYLLASVLSALDPVAPGNSVDAARAEFTQSDMMSFMAKKLAISTEWKDPGLKATVLLKWTLFLTDARHRNPQLEHRSGFKTEELETQIWNAVQSDAFTYLTLAVVQLERRRGSPMPSYANTLTLSPEQQEQRELPSEDFTPTVLSAFEILVRSLITHASSELRKIKQRQEDLVLASARTDRTRPGPARFASSIASESDRPAASPRGDIALLYSFIGLLYSALPPERALQFWGSTPLGHSLTYLEYTESTLGRLPVFLQWAVWSTQMHDVTMSTALYDMLAGLANGQHCSELAHNFMARGGGEVVPGSSLPSSSVGGPSVSWTVIFGLLDSWAASNSAVRAGPPPQAFGNTLGMSSFSNPPPPQQTQAPAIGPKDVLLAQSFLRLLSTVVTHSVAVRKAIAGHTHFRAIPTIVSLIPLGIPLELKGTLFDALAAFCQPGAGAPGLEICKSVWLLMERLEVINVRVGSSSGFSVNLPPVKGVEMELDEIEALHKLYPATIPFLRLLSTLIHTPKRISLKDRVVEANVNTIPESLGQPYRLPGIGPFITFVIDNVFANIPNREYLHPSDRWQTNDLCLCFIERALASFDLESLGRASNDAQLKGETILALLAHPGYDISKRLLTDSPLQSSLLTYVVEGLAGFENGLADEEPYFGSTIVRVLRIILRVLEIQDIFLDVLLPLLHELDSAPVVGTVHPRSYFTRFDQALSYGTQYVPALAAYVSFSAHPELVLLSVKILSSLSSSSAFSSLYTVIERSDESDRIMAGFVRILGTESATDVLLAENIAEEWTGAGAPDTNINANSAPLEQAIRLAALQLFIRNTEADRPYPNIAHFFLFGNTRTEFVIQDPHALGAKRTCVHVILDLANVGVPRLDESDGPVPDSDPLFVTLSGLAELFYRVIYQLCTHARTSEFIMRYLRTREDFFARQLAAIPSQVPATIQDAGIEVTYADGAHVLTTVPALSSFLRLRSWIFDLAALDLHVLTSKGHFKGVAELLDILFGTNNKAYQWSHDGFQEVGQSHLRIIEFVQSLAFDWADALKVEPVDLRFLGQLNLLSCVRKDATGCEVIDRTALLSLLTLARRTLNAQGSVVTQAHADQLDAEISYILESCAVENHRREVAHAKSTGYESWKRLLDMTLTKCFTRLPHDHRENILFDLLHILPMILRSEDMAESTAVLLSEAVLSSVTKLRANRRHQVLVQSANGDADAGSLPAERLYAILRNILESIVDNNRVELVRGNLYAAMINYVQLVTPSSSDTQNHKASAGLTTSLAASTTHEDFLFGESQAPVPVSQSGRPVSSVVSLELGSLALMKPVIERFIATVSRDAIDGSEVWKTIAFMLLDSLVQLSGLEKQHIVLSTLVRQGVLTNFVRGVKESDLRLQSVLKPDPDDLNPLYVYEAKMSFFVRMAQTRLGAERLLDAQLIPILSQCDYLDARPEADQSFMDQGSFLPSAIHRYHQLLMPALQLVDGMLATLGTKHATVSNQTLDFLSSHSATIVILLKNETEQIPLALVEEMHLIVSLCASVLTHVPKSELLSPHSGFGAIHGAVLALATKCLGGGRWLAGVLPQTDAEMLSASTLALGYGSETKFDICKRQKERVMRKSIVEYIGAASEFTEPDIAPILSPITATPRHDERGPHFLATIPTMGDALDALNVLCGDLSSMLTQIADISAELAAKEHVNVENINELLPDADPTFLRSLDIPQKRALACRELARVRRVAEGEARTLLGTLEMVLLLLWRHLLYYAEGHPTVNSSANLKASTASSLRFLSPPEPETFRNDVAQRLAPVLARLAELDLGDEWLRASAGYVEIMGRRLRDSAGILGDAGEM